MGAEEPQEKNSDADSATAKAEHDEFGFLKNLFCPFCGSEKLKPSHTDDVGTQFYKCENCGRHCTRPKTKERKELEEALTKPLEPAEFPQKYFDEHDKFVPKLLAEELMSEYRTNRVNEVIDYIKARNWHGTHLNYTKNFSRRLLKNER